MRQFISVSFVLLMTVAASAAETRAKISARVQVAFGIDGGEVFATANDGATLRDGNVYTQNRMVVTTTQRATLHQACLTSESRFVMLEGFGGAADEKLRARFEAFLLENLAAHGVDQAVIAKLPTPVSASVEKVNCFSDASEAVLGLTYAEGKGYFKIEIAVAEFN